MSEPARMPAAATRRRPSAVDRLRRGIRDRDTTGHRSSNRAHLAVANAELFHEQIRVASHATTRSGLTGLLLIQIDDLSAIGDQLGPDVADEVRTALAQRLSSQLGDDDLAGELDDETFAVVVRDASGSDIRNLHGRINESLARPVRVSGFSLVCHVEFGVATASTEVQHAGLWRRARADLSGNTEGSVNAGDTDRRWIAETSVRAHGQTDDLHDDLDFALRNQNGGTPGDHGLAVHYQPIVELATRTTQGFEALIRWQHRSRGFVPAAEIIDLAERTDLIVPLGDWVLNRALVDAQALGSARSAPSYVSVNVSATQLLQPGFAERTRRRVAAAGLEPSRLVVEITESQIVQDDDHIWDDLADLRKLGIQIAIDDYGTGYASLAYLRHPVIDMLKLDRTFLAGIEQPRGRTILQSVVSLTASLGISLVAEGVEDEQTRSMLIDSGCTLGQGHLYAAAMPLSAAMEWEPGHL
jgi:diguanylate cyclase (GGDEF)-like protein